MRASLVARATGNALSQGGLTQDCIAAGFETNQPVVGRYLHYLADALLVRVPVKVTLIDLGVRNAIFRGAPSLWESPPEVLRPLVETLVQTVLRGVGLQVHFYRDYSIKGNRRSALEVIDFVVEALDGRVIPVEIKFRKCIDGEDFVAIRAAMFAAAEQLVRA